MILQGRLVKGFLRRYYIDEMGEIITNGFYIHNAYPTDYAAFLQQKASSYFIECLEPCTLILMPYAKVQQAYQQYKSSERYGRLIAEQVLTRETARVESFLFKNATQRYLEFAKNNPDLLKVVSVTHLASYLGIKRQSLSRIRSALQKK